MLARIFSSVLLPDPLRPTIPKNSPWWTSNDTSLSARSSRYFSRVNGCVTRSLSVSIRCSGIRKDLETPRASITIGPEPAPARVGAVVPVAPPSLVVEIAMSAVLARRRARGSLRLTVMGLTDPGTAAPRRRMTRDTVRSMIGTELAESRARTPIGDARAAQQRLALPWPGVTVTVALLTIVGVAIRVIVAHQPLFADELSTYWVVGTHRLSVVVSPLRSMRPLPHESVTPLLRR